MNYLSLSKVIYKICSIIIYIIPHSKKLIWYVDTNNFLHCAFRNGTSLQNYLNKKKENNKAQNFVHSKAL